jgi:6-pyruvoyl-tetrahydropterin synthase related domain
VAAPTTETDAVTTIAREARARVGVSLDGDDQRALWERAMGWAVVALCTWLVFCIMDPGHSWSFVPGHLRFGDLFRNTTANGGDMGAHVWWPKFLADNWFPKLRLSGWAPDWYAGFPVGQYYFPVPALMIWVLKVVMPYNVAFKLVTVSGPLMLPAAAYSFAKGMKAPWPAPPAFAIAAFGTLVQTRSDWQIYGGNIASTLAGEFSFTIGLAFALFGLGALAYTLDTGRRRWLPALLIALAIMSHIVVAIFIAIAAFLLWLTRRPQRTWAIALPVGSVAVALSAVWILPLLWQQKFTQSMRYTKLLPKGNFTLPSWIPVPGAVRNTLEGLWNGVARPPLDTNANPVKHFSPTLWLPWWIWLLAGVAIIAAGWYRRRSTLVLIVLAMVVGVMFVEWPEHAIWNTRFLPFWLLSWAFLAAMGATEIARFLAFLVSSAYAWIRDGDLQDARARAWAEIATADDDSAVAPEARKEAAWALADRRFDRGPEGWEPPARLSRTVVERGRRRLGAIGLAVVVALGGAYALNRAFTATGNNSAIAIRGWASWNYSGYESKASYPQYKAIMTGMEQVADAYGNGRALWEPSSGEPDAINSYGTSLALMLLPYFTHGKIASMEGIYFESSATTDYHFLTVSECAQHPSNPVRGLVYGSPTADFDLCVKHLQMLGVRYYMAWTPETQKLASRNPQLTLVKDIRQSPPIAGPPPDKQLKDWKVYEVSNSDLVVGMDREPVVVTSLPSGRPKYSKCWDETWQASSGAEPRMQDGWECTTAPWWVNRDLLNTAYAQTGPSNWMRVKASDLAKAPPRKVTPAQVSNVRTSVDKISFDVSEIGKPVEVKESYFPNWHVSGAKGPYRLAPNLMVVVPTSTHVQLTYGLTTADWAGRVITVAGAVGLVLLGLWTGARRFAAGTHDDDDTSDDPDRDGEQPDVGHGAEEPNVPPDGPPPGPSEGEPPNREEPAPALP